MNFILKPGDLMRSVHNTLHLVIDVFNVNEELDTDENSFLISMYTLSTLANENHWVFHDTVRFDFKSFRICECWHSAGCV